MQRSSESFKQIEKVVEVFSQNPIKLCMILALKIKIKLLRTCTKRGV